jgi:hypothetical protein
VDTATVRALQPEEVVGTPQGALQGPGSWGFERRIRVFQSGCGHRWGMGWGLPWGHGSGTVTTTRGWHSTRPRAGDPGRRRMAGPAGWGPSTASSAPGPGGAGRQRGGAEHPKSSIAPVSPHSTEATGPQGCAPSSQVTRPACSAGRGIQSALNKCRRREPGVVVHACNPGALSSAPHSSGWVPGQWVN